MTATKPIMMMWSYAAFSTCFRDLKRAQQRILHGISELVPRMNGAFFHTLATNDGVLLRCDALEKSDGWLVYIRLAQVEGGVPKYPAAIASPENEQFAEYWDMREQKKR